MGRKASCRQIQYDTIFFFKKFIYLRKRARESTCESVHEWERQRERERESKANFTLSMESHEVLDLITVRPQPEPKPRVGYPTDCAIQVPQHHIFNT